jgi:hypothetical protein
MFWDLHKHEFWNTDIYTYKGVINVWYNTTQYCVFTASEMEQTCLYTKSATSPQADIVDTMQRPTLFSPAHIWLPNCAQNCLQRYSSLVNYGSANYERHCKHSTNNTRLLVKKGTCQIVLASTEIANGRRCTLYQHSLHLNDLIYLR